MAGARRVPERAGVRRPLERAGPWRGLLGPSREATQPSAAAPGQCSVQPRGAGRLPGLLCRDLGQRGVFIVMRGALVLEHEMGHGTQRHPWRCEE